MLFNLLFLFLINLYLFISNLSEGHSKLLSYLSTKISIFAASQKS